MSFLSMSTYIRPKLKMVYFSVYRKAHLGFNYTRAQKVKELAVRAACEARKFARSATIIIGVSESKLPRIFMSRDKTRPTFEP